MMDESADFFIEDIRQDDNDVLEYVPSPVSIPSKKGTRVLPWTDGDEGYHGHYSPQKSSFGSGIFGSASPKKLGSFASSFLGRPKQMSPSTPSKLIAKSPPLAPASPYAYIPAIERVRYLSFSTQEQSEVQKRPYTPPRPALGGGVNGFGVYSGSQASEDEFNVSPPPTGIVQKWLENQDSNLSDSSSVVAPSLSEQAEQSTTSAVSPWSHINRTQEIMNVSPKSQSSKPVLQSPIAIPIRNAPKLPDSTFKRSNSIVSSPPGPSGLTLLIKQSSTSPSILDHAFEEKSSGNPGDPTFKGKTLPGEDEESIIIVDKDNNPKSDLLQVPGIEQVRSKTPSTTSGGAIGNISALLKWGGSWIGYGNEDPNNNQSNHSITTTNNNNQNEEINAEKPHKALPLHPEYATNTSKARAIKVDEMGNIVQNGKDIFDAEIDSEIPEDKLVRGRSRNPLPPPPEDATNTKKARAIKVDKMMNIVQNGKDVFDAEVCSEILEDKGRSRNPLPPPPEDATNTKKARAIKVNEVINIAQNSKDVFDAKVRLEIPEDKLVKGRSRNPLPPPPEDATNTKKARAIKANGVVNIAKNNQDIFGSEIVSTDIGSSQVTSAPVEPITQKPRRNLPPIPTKSPSLKAEMPTNVIAESDGPTNKNKAISATIENEISLSSTLADTTSETNTKSSSPPVPPKPPKLAASPPKPPKPSNLASSPPKPPKPTAMTSNQNIPKASIFAPLGQKKLGLTGHNAVPSSVVQGGKPGSASPPSKQTGFNVPRKPVSQNNLMNVEEQDVNTNEFGSDGESKDSLLADVSKISILIDNVPSTGPSSNVNSDEISQAPPKFEESKDANKDPFGEIIIPSELINASPPKKTSLPTISSAPISTTNLTRKKTFSQHKLKPMLPTLPQTILTNTNNENMIIEEETTNETSKFSSSPISQYSKITSTPTTYVNTTIAKPVIVPLLQKNNDIDDTNNKTALKKSRKKKKLGDELVNKIVEPPKQVLSPRLQEYINKYNKATYGD